jgi:hypothetical protein
VFSTGYRAPDELPELELEPPDEDDEEDEDPYPPDELEELMPG